MLAPRDRRLLLDTLRPPLGYRLDRAIGTTFSLDLVALLVAPLAFTLFDWTFGGGDGRPDPLALLQALRRHAGRIHLFCQAGRIAVPGPDQRLLAYLESCVVEVTAPQGGGVFHPKVWLLRYVADEGPVVYRFLCLSRNLTFERTWDTALMLEGPLRDGETRVRRNRPLGDFVAALGGWMRRPVQGLRSALTRMSEEVRRVDFELPPGFDDLSFRPLGFDRYTGWPFPDERRDFLVVAPFLSSEGPLPRLLDSARSVSLISRPDALAELAPEVRDRCSPLWVLADGAEPETADMVAVDNLSEGTEVELQPADADTPSLVGLHAKLYVMDDGWNARLWTGSANATDAAFSRNVEFLVELRGKKSDCGIEALLGDASSGGGLHSLLAPFTSREHVGLSEEERLAAAAVERLRGTLANARFSLEVEPDEGGSFAMDLVIPGRMPKLPAEARVVVWPVTLPQSAARDVPLSQGGRVRFTALSFEAVTSFLAFEVTVQRGDVIAAARFALNLPLAGAPADRHERILLSLLQDRQRVMRLLLLLLSEEGQDVAAWVETFSGGNGTRNMSAAAESGLLEPLLRALVRSPERLDEAAALIADLQRTAEGAQLLPEGLADIWEPIWAARREAAKGGSA